MVRRPGSQYEMLVIGGGLCGLSAAHHAARCGARSTGYDTTLFEITKVNWPAQYVIP